MEGRGFFFNTLHWIVSWRTWQWAVVSSFFLGWYIERQIQGLMQDPFIPDYYIFISYGNTALSYVPWIVGVAIALQVVRDTDIDDGDYQDDIIDSSSPRTVVLQLPSIQTWLRSVAACVLVMPIVGLMAYYFHTSEPESDIALLIQRMRPALTMVVIVISHLILVGVAFRFIRSILKNRQGETFVRNKGALALILLAIVFTLNKLVQLAASEIWLS